MDDKSEKISKIAKRRMAMKKVEEDELKLWIDTQVYDFII